MLSQHRFVRSRKGIASFAAVEVASTPAPTWSITWAGTLAHLEKIYRAAVDEGVRIAQQAHEARGGAPQSVEIASLVEVLVDTKPDAVRCATAIAAWKSWGHNEAAASITLEDEQWRVAFGK